MYSNSNTIAVNNTERDSTAIVKAESHFFVLSKESIIKFAVLFPHEFEEVAVLA